MARTSWWSCQTDIQRHYNRQNTSCLDLWSSVKTIAHYPTHVRISTKFFPNNQYKIETESRIFAYLRPKAPSVQLISHQHICTYHHSPCPLVAFDSPHLLLLCIRTAISPFTTIRHFQTLVSISAKRFANTKYRIEMEEDIMAYLQPSSPPTSLGLTIYALTITPHLHSYRFIAPPTYTWYSCTLPHLLWYTHHKIKSNVRISIKRFITLQYKLDTKKYLYMSMYLHSMDTLEPLGINIKTTDKLCLQPFHDFHAFIFHFPLYIFSQQQYTTPYASCS